MLPGKAVVEIKQMGFNKATAVRKFMTVPPFRGRLPIFIGDDQTDEIVFPVIRELGGLGFSVGRQIPEVAGFFDAPTDVRRWLQTIAVGHDALIGQSFVAAIEETGVAEAGADREYAPAFDVLHERHLAQPLNDGVVVHDDVGVFLVDFRNCLPQRGRQIEFLAFPVARKILRAAIDRAVALR